MRGLGGFALLAVLCALTTEARAQAQPEVADPHALEVHGFVSQGFLVTIENNFLTESTDGSFEMTEVGLNFTKPITDELRVGIQVFARDLGTVGNYDAQLDWFYIDYRWSDWLGFRAGRVKVPFGLYNEINDIDAARPNIFLPLSIYPVENRDYLLAQTGVELYGYVDAGNAGAFEYRLYGGTIFLDTVAPPSIPYEIEAINVPYLAGARVFWETPLQGLRIGGSAQILRLNLDVIFDGEAYMPLQMMGALPADFTGLVSAEVPASLLLGSIEYAANDWLFAFEYTRWFAELESSMPLLVPEQSTTSEALYLLAAYRVLPWFQPAAYYSLRFEDIDDRDRRSKFQHDTALTLRFDINEHWIVKVEGHYFHGTALLRPAINDGTPKAELDRDWALFVAKTTAYF